ncbi:hypothetical protein C1645_727317 [Glomus cerebriforme]|uniref:Uncharacterized protein n=1 Tax=Glomus cerebriforme TaxID=658196 RepID=A0A397SIH7_9GLOM|nr:hypothetical protein C1645_727317 [Glomus cerebriforme]
MRSQKCKNLDALEEIIDLLGSDNFEIIPHSQLVTSRQAYSNNTSKYFING